MLAARMAAFTAPARPIASVPTGIPAGICTIESSESIPCSAFDSTGTPRTGRSVFDAHMPGRCAAPPAPAMMTLMPRARAEAAYSKRRSGVRCAETTRHSNGTASDSSAAEACCIVSQSDCEPMMIPTSGCAASFGMARCYVKRRLVWAAPSVWAAEVLPSAPRSTEPPTQRRVDGTARGIARYRSRSTQERSRPERGTAPRAKGIA